MKAKQLFLLINQIDDELISDAVSDSGQPMEVVMERRFPIREILACAACAAVLVIGVFAVVKVRGGIDTPPDSYTSSSAPDVTNSSVSILAPNDSNVSGAPNDPNKPTDPDAWSSTDSPSNPGSESSEDTGSTTSSTDDPKLDPGMVTDSDFPDIEQPFMTLGSFEDALRGIMLRAKTVEQLESDIAAADTDGRVLSVAVTKKTDKVEYYKTGEPVTEGSIENDMVIRVAYDAEKNGLIYIVGNMLDYFYGDIISGNFTEEVDAKAERVKDTVFSYIVQPFMESGSFEDTLRGIMLRAQTVEQLKSDIAATDTDGRVFSVAVTKKTDKVEYYKTGEPVTEGNIEDDMVIRVMYDAGNNGLVYFVGNALDFFYGDILSGDFPSDLMRIIDESQTVEELKQRISERDADERVISVIVDGEFGEVTEGALTSGMTVHIKYDNNRAYMDVVKS